MSHFTQYELSPLKTKSEWQTSQQTKPLQKPNSDIPKAYALILKTGKDILLWEKLIPNFSCFRFIC